MDELIRYVKKILTKIMLSPIRLLGIKRNRVFMINDLAYNYSCSPRSLTEYLISNYGNELEIYFSVKNPEKYNDYDNHIIFVKTNSFRYFYYAITAKVIITNSGGFSYLPISKKQVVINTNHGGGCYKKVGLDMFEDTYLFRKDLLLSAKYTTASLSTCKKYSDIASKVYLLPRNVFWEIGMPRNDIMLNCDDVLRNKIRNKLGITEGKKLVLYAPTYRKPKDNYFRESIAIDYDIDTCRVCNALNKRFGGTWIFGYRLHPCVVNRNIPKKDDIVDFSDYEEMQELLLAADVMINDFSSSMWDFMLTGKPSFLYAKDLEHYIKTTEVYTPISEWPFPKSTTNEELEKTILEFDFEKYSKDCKRHYDSLGGCESGKATQIVGDYIYKSTHSKKILPFKE